MKKLLITLMLILVLSCMKDNNVLTPYLIPYSIDCNYVIVDIEHNHKKIILEGGNPKVWISPDDVPEEFVLISTDSVTYVHRDWDNCFVRLQTDCFGFVTLLW